MRRAMLASCLVSALVSATVTLLLVTWAAPSRTTPPVITAQRFEVVDQDGKLKASLVGPPANDALVILDSQGVERIRLFVLAEGTAFVALFDQQGRVRSRLSVNRQGANDLTLYGEDGRPVHSLAAPAFETVPR